MELYVEVIIAMWLPCALGIAYLIYRRRSPKGVAATIHVLICILIAVFFAVMASMLYLHRTRPHVAFEFPLEIADSGKSENEFWMTLPPGLYVASLLCFPESQHPEPAGRTAEIEIEYSLLMGGQVIEAFSGPRDFSLRGPRVIALGVGIPVESATQEIHIKLHTKCALGKEQIPAIRFAIQTFDEMKLKKEGYSINRKTFDPAIAY